MSLLNVDRCRIPPNLWRYIERTGLKASAVLQTAGLPESLYRTPDATVSTAQLFAFWKAIEELSGDPGIGIAIVEQSGPAGYPPAFITVLYAATFRDAIERLLRFKRSDSTERYWTEEKDGLWSMGRDWPFAVEGEPAVSVDIAFAFIVTLGRNGTGKHLRPFQVQYSRPPSPSSALERFYDCSIEFRAPRNAITFSTSDLDTPFAWHSPEFLDLVTPGLQAALQEGRSASRISDRVKAIAKMVMPSGRLEIANIARELCMSERSLQRRISDDGTTFRALVNDARRELSLQILRNPRVEIAQVAAMLGYQDTTSFYRAFKEWEGLSPGEWRAAHVGEHS